MSSFSIVDELLYTLVLQNNLFSPPLVKQAEGGTRKALRVLGAVKLKLARRAEFVLDTAGQFYSEETRRRLKIIWKSGEEEWRNVRMPRAHFRGGKSEPITITGEEGDLRSATGRNF